MCGIAGIISSKKISKSVGEDFVSSLSHRGPDDAGVFLGSGVLLAHTRLSIIDTSSGGHQPMTYSHKGNTVTLVYNGELYNYQTVKKQLEKKGYRFNSESDSEVLCAMYLEYKESCVEHFEGMFAFVIYNHTSHEFFGAVDRFSQKPLFYIEKDNQFIFASEVKALLPHLNEKVVDYTAISLYLSLGYIPAPYTGFRGIQKMMAGTSFYIKGNDCKMHQTTYFSITHCADSSKKIDKDTVRILLDDAVKKRLVADVPVGTFLSGGVDSTLITAIAKKYEQDLHTFSIAFDSKKHDESLFATIASKRLKTSHHSKRITRTEMETFLPEVIEHMDVPFADPSLIPTYLLSKHAREGVTVALSGDAGDENFGGYQKYRAWYLVSLFPRFAQYMLPIFSSIFSRKLGQVCENASKSLSDKYIEVTNFFTKKEKIDLCDAEWYGQDATSMLTTTIQKVDELSLPLPQKLMMLDFLYYIPGNIHPKVDMASMKASLEVRAPFIDHTLVCASLHLSMKEKISLKGGKLFLKELLLEWFPASFVQRKKHGFTIPLEDWIPKNVDWSTLEKLHLKKIPVSSPEQKYALHVLASWYKKHFL